MSVDKDNRVAEAAQPNDQLRSKVEKLLNKYQEDVDALRACLDSVDWSKTLPNTILSDVREYKHVSADDPLLKFLRDQVELDPDIE